MFSIPRRRYPSLPRQLSKAVRIALLSLLLFSFVINSGRLDQSQWVAATAAPLPAVTNTLRVMSWNAYFLNKNTDGFLHAVAEEQPDLIAIQELGNQLASVIPEQLRQRYPYQELYPTGSPAGMAVLSRYPFLTTSLPDFDEGQGCNCQVITLAIAGTTVTLINAHPWPPAFAFTWTGHWSDLLGLDTAPQDPIFDALLARIDEATGPLLVMGDLNTMPFQPNVQRLNAILTDSFMEAGKGMGYTFPLEGKDYNFPPIPFMRIDYIFHDTAWTTTAMAVGTIAGSDHRYIVADLVLRNAKE